MTSSSMIYKIVPSDDWAEAEAKDVFEGASIDLADGYIHFSTTEQVAETAAKHFSGQDNLYLVAVPVSAIEGDLKWEVSRGGALFPHLYQTLPVDKVAWVKPMPIGPDGVHILPDLEG